MSEAMSGWDDGRFKGFVDEDAIKTNIHKSTEDVRIDTPIRYDCDSIGCFQFWQMFVAIH